MIPMEWAVTPLQNYVIPGLDPGIHVQTFRETTTWMAGSSPAMTDSEKCSYSAFFSGSLASFLMVGPSALTQAP